MIFDPRQRRETLSASDKLAPFEHAERPALARALKIWFSVDRLNAIDKKFADDSKTRHQQARGWQKENNVVGASVGIVSDAVQEMAAGSALGDLHATPDVAEINRRTEALLRDKESTTVNATASELTPPEPIPLSAVPPAFIDEPDNPRLESLQRNARIDAARALADQARENFSTRDAA